MWTTAAPILAGACFSLAAPAPLMDKPDAARALERKLVGEWTGKTGCDGCFVFRADGTYELTGYGPAPYDSKGTWKVRWDALPPTLALTCTASEVPEEVGQTTEVKLVKLDDKALAIEYANPNGSPSGHYNRVPKEAGRAPTTWKGYPPMSESKPSKVFMADNSDPEMQQAYENARATFKYFWREVAWERRRIIPAVDMACVKAPFSDGKSGKPTEGNPEVEHMWLGEIDFDGRLVSGVLLNSPNWITSVKAGDRASLPVAQISDWMYAIDGKVYGAYTVNLLRSRMSARERQEHDAAWGLDFGDPQKIRIVSEEEHQALCEGMASSLKDALAKTPSLVSATGHNGWTLLHQNASAGSTATLKVLLEAGADPNAVTDQGLTPLQLARSLGWDTVAALLQSKGAK